MSLSTFVDSACRRRYDGRFMSVPQTLARRSTHALSSLGLLAFIALLLASPQTNLAQAGDEVRALWVTRASITTPAAIAAVVESARTSGFNTLLVQVRGRGDAYFTSTLEPRADALAGQAADFDPLAEVIAQAHAQGLHVHAWTNVDLIAS